MNNPIAEKYRPKKYSDIVGQLETIRELEKFIREFPKKKAIILHGPSGTGKTTLVLALAKEHNLDILELNSSDLRNKLKLEETLKPASEQQSLFKRGKILLMDEIDGVTGTDRGGVQELIRIINTTIHPIIMTCNDIWQSKFSQLRQKCKLIEIKPLSKKNVFDIIKKTSDKENIEVDLSLLLKIAEKSQGDARAALNDLQVYLTETESLDFINQRNREENIFNILKILFKERGDFLELFDNTKMSLDEILLWIEENIPKEYKGKELAKAYIALSNADRFRGRIYRQQFWRFLIYQNIFQSAGISYAKDKTRQSSFTKYEKPKRILKIWLNNQKTAKKKTIAQKYSKFVHCSTKRAMRDFSLIKKIISNNPQAHQKLRLSDDEIDFLKA